MSETKPQECPAETQIAVDVTIPQPMSVKANLRVESLRGRHTVYLGNLVLGSIAEVEGAFCFKHRSTYLQNYATLKEAVESLFRANLTNGPLLRIEAMKIDWSQIV